MPTTSADSPSTRLVSPPNSDAHALALQEALAALGESERRTTTILESLPVGVVVTDARGFMTYTNPAAVALGIETPRDDDGNALPYFEVYSAATRRPYAQSMRPLAQALRGATVVADDMLLRPAIGDEIPIECRATPMRSDDGEIVLPAWKTAVVIGNWSLVDDPTASGGTRVASR